MAVALRRVCFQSLHLQRSLSVGVASNAKKTNGDDPIKKLFLDKLAEFNKTKPPLSPALDKQFKGDMERLKGVYGADKEDITQFPKFEYPKEK